MIEWNDSVALLPDTECHVYIARITGEDETYRFRRKFQSTDMYYGEEKLYFSAELENNQIYEICARWYMDDPKHYIRRERLWILLFDGIPYELEESEILWTLYNLQLQSSSNQFTYM